MERTNIKSAFEQVLASTDELRMVVITQTPFMCAAVNDGGRPALFVRVSLAPSQIVSDGLGFAVRTTRSGNNDYVQVTAADRGLPPLFLKLVEYLLERVGATTSAGEGIEVLIRSIDEYRRFVGMRRGRLSEALVRGTFAELQILRLLIDSGMPADEAVAAWRGPWAKAGLGVHDFTFADGRGIEVKSTHQPPTTIRVSSPSQLLPSSEPLDLLVLPIEDAPEGTLTAVSFRSYAIETGELIATGSPAATEMWDAALDALRLDLSDEWYERYRFLAGQWRRFEVKEGFPHLDLPSFPAGVVDVRYSLELPKLAPFTAPLRDLLTEMELA